MENDVMETNIFSGPLFIVGRDRSGTKLLRDLLNRNPQIGIPVIESNFIPYMIHRFGIAPNFENKDEFDRFFDTFKRTTFYWLFKKTTGRELMKDYINRTGDKTSWSSIFELIFRFYSPRGRDENFIWGDKTPAYLKHMKLLKELFPEARFLHIIRDPRDVCLSEKKTWGKSLYRAANTWRETLAVARGIGHQFGKEYKEVFYESLLENPKKTLIDICKFLDCKFTIDMTRLDNPSENLGDTRGMVDIVQNNKNKYITQLSPSQVKRIEEIVWPVAKSLGYKFENDVEFVPLGPIKLKILRVYNACTSLKFYVKSRGLYRAIWLISKEWTESRLSH
jgi:hypothetical protein